MNQTCLSITCNPSCSCGWCAGPGTCSVTCPESSKAWIAAPVVLSVAAVVAIIVVLCVMHKRGHIGCQCYRSLYHPLPSNKPTPSPLMGNTKRQAFGPGAHAHGPATYQPSQSSASIPIASGPVSHHAYPATNPTTNHAAVTASYSGLPRHASSSSTAGGNLGEYDMISPSALHNGESRATIFDNSTSTGRKE